MAKGWAYTDDEDSDTGAVAKPLKSRRANNDKPTTGPAESRTRRARKPTAKQADNEKENRDATAAEVEKLRKQLAASQKKLQRSRELVEQASLDDNGVESEDSVEEEISMSNFPTGIISNGVVSHDKDTLKKLRPGNPRNSEPLTPKPPAPTTRKKASSASKTPSNATTPRPRPPSGLGGSRSDGSQSDDTDSNPNTSSLGKHGRSSSVCLAESSDPPVPKHSKCSASTSIVAQFVGGQAPRGRRLNLGDFEAPASTLLLRCIRLYEACISTQTPFPDQEHQLAGAHELWAEVRMTSGLDMELTDRMCTLITKRGSHARGALKDAVRPLIAGAYGFKSGDSRGTISHNQQLHSRLLANASFHYKNPKERQGYAGHPIIRTAIQAVWFKTRKSPGVVLEQYFNPIPVVSMALIFTAIEFCIEEWALGQFTMGVFDESSNKAQYMVHLKDLEGWTELNTEVTTRIRVNLFDRCRRYTGAAPKACTTHMTDDMITRARDELDGRTGDTESEASAEEGGEDCEEA